MRNALLSCALACVGMLSVPLHAASLSYTRLHTAVDATGSITNGGLFQASDGKLYGVMASGGTPSGGGVGFGVLYRINTDGSGYVPLHVFSVDADGVTPSGMLAEGSDGRLYGVCSAGGLTAGGLGGLPAGTLYRINKDGSGFQVVKQFEPASGTSSASTTGQRAVEGLVAASDGKLYGFTSQGGTTNRGVLYSVTPAAGAATYSVIFNLASQSLSEPVARPVEGPDGKLYGITQKGGAGFGVLFRIAKNGSGFELLHQFTSAERAPESIVRVSDSLLVGSTFTFGNSENTLFGYDFTAAGTTGFSQIADFTSSVVDRNFNVSTVGSDGKLYGNRFDVDSGFNFSNGAICRVNADGTAFETLLTFAAGDGSSFFNPLLEISPLSFVGATFDGGPFDRGTIFLAGEATAVLPDSLSQTGPKKIKTSKGKVAIAGTCDGGQDFVVEFRVGKKGKFKPAKGTSKWKLKAVVKPGKNIVFIRASLADGSVSKELKVKVIRK